LEIKNLPQHILQILEKLNASSRLIKHLRIVHSVAFELIQRLKEEFPSVLIDEHLVLFGAATHDIGKVEVREELFKAGKKHESIGVKILLNLGFSEKEARFAKTHGNWYNENLALEDLLISLADKIWKGKRINELEEIICQKLSESIGINYWDIYPKLDSILDKLSINADKRIVWQSVD